MRHFFLHINILIALSLIAFSCDNNDDKEMLASLDSLKNKVDSAAAFDTALTKGALENILIEYSQKYRAVTNYSSLGKAGSRETAQKLKSGYLLIPVLKNQLERISPDSATDTVLTYFNESASAFVFEAEKGAGKISNLDARKNGIVLFKPEKVESSLKMYLMKNSREFQHKARKVNEYYIEGIVIDAFSINADEKTLMQKFGLETQ